MVIPGAGWQIIALSTYQAIILGALAILMLRYLGMIILFIEKRVSCV